MTIESALERSRLVVFAGLPGSGKSFWIRRAAHRARAMGRRITVLQWDSAREAYETPEWCSRWPELDGVTHPGVRLSVSEWSRWAIANWFRDAGSENEVLLAESSFLGGRMNCWLEVRDDEAEALLSEHADFLVPVPTERLRRRLREARILSDGSRLGEKGQASIDVLDETWGILLELARSISETHPDLALSETYDPATYAAIYGLLLSSRRHRVISVYDFITDERSDTGRSPIRSLKVHPDQCLRFASDFLDTNDQTLEELADRYQRSLHIGKLESE